MLLVPWKRLVFGPPFLFQISNDVQPCCGASMFSPKNAHLLNACKAMAQFALAHPVWSAERCFVHDLVSRHPMTFPLVERLDIVSQCRNAASAFGGTSSKRKVVPSPGIEP
jgi:hypothetical protein